jgi:KaiC/GvpD/RAD55 family RecA-like ATPase
VKDRKLSFLEYTPLSVDASVDMLNEIVKTVVDSRATRLVIDSLNALLGEIPAAEQRRMLEIVINKILKGAECTVIGIIEQSIGKNEIGLGREEFVADGLIMFESYSDGLEVKKRAVIRKMRGSMHSSRYQGIMLRPREGISFFPLVE